MYLSRLRGLGHSVHVDNGSFLYFLVSLSHSTDSEVSMTYRFGPVKTYLGTQWVTSFLGKTRRIFDAPVHTPCRHTVPERDSGKVPESSRNHTNPEVRPLKSPVRNRGRVST